MANHSQNTAHLLGSLNLSELVKAEFWAQMDVYDFKMPEAMFQYTLKIVSQGDGPWRKEYSGEGELPGVAVCCLVP